MKPAGGRLTVSAAISRNTSLDSSVLSSTSTSQSNSAKVTKAEKQIKCLKEENSKLRKDLENVRSLYSQLTMENSHENFDERRISLLKSQLIQMERQVLLMSEALSSRSETLMEVENALTWLADKWRYYIGVEVRGAEVSVPRADMTQMVHTAESARIKLYKNIENTSVERLTKPSLFMNEFIKPGHQEEITLLDIASGKLEHLNVKHVAKLETKLASLYKQLICLNEVMNSEDCGVQQHRSTSKHVATVVKDHLTTQILKSCAMMKDCCGDLMYLSLLYPSAPWPPLKRSMIKDVTCDKVMKTLPSLPRGKSTEVQKVVEALLKAFNFKHHMMSHEIKSLKEDIKFHTSVYNLQLNYIENLFSVVREGYTTFEKSTDEVIAKPMRDILESYAELKATASEDALKEFLKKMDQHAEKCEKNTPCKIKMDFAVEKMSLKDGNGSEAFSEFGEEFLRELDQLILKCQTTRDKAVRDRADLKEQQEKLEEELRQFLDEQELKYKEHFVADNSQETEKNEMTQQDVLIYMKESDTVMEDKDLTENILVVESGVGEIDLESENDVKKNKNVKKKGLSNASKTASQKESTGIENESGSPSNHLPPKCKKKTGEKIKRNYVPNTFVPNRTLQLRRSGSITQIDKPKEKWKTVRSPSVLPDVKKSSHDSFSDLDNEEIEIKRGASSSLSDENRSSSKMDKLDSSRDSRNLQNLSDRPSSASRRPSSGSSRK